MSYTKGPWKVEPFLTPDKDDDPMMVYHVIAGNLQERFDSLETDADGEYDYTVVDAIHAENVANARLIAAAPELLEALEGAVRIIEQDLSRQEINEYRHEIIALIAKAKGV